MLAVSLVVCVWTAPVRADDAAPAEVMVVSARGRETAVSQTPGGIGLIDDEELFVTQPLSLTDTTRRIPGVETSSDAAWGSEINIRGLDRNRIVFLIDGVRINTATDLPAQFGLVDPSDIARVEVLKGPISALYGSGSIGGVVNVVTRGAAFTDSPEWHGGLSLSYGTNPEGFGVYARSSYSDERFHLFLSGSFRDRDEYRNADHDSVDNSQFDDWSGRLRLGRKWDEANTTELQYMRYDGHEIGIPGKGLTLLPDDNRHVTYPDTTLQILSLTHTILPDPEFWTESRLQLYFSKNERRVRIDQLPVPVGEMKYPVRIDPSADHRTFGLNWRNTMELADHTLVWGVDGWLWTYDGIRRKYVYRVPFDDIVVATDSPLADSNQYSAGLFAEDDWRLTEALTLNLGARVDRMVSETEANESDASGLADEGTFHAVSWAAHAGLTWEFRPQWSATLLAASSYRAPDIFDRFKYITLSSGGTLYGNPDLEPERSLFLEAGLHYSGDRVRGSASAFVNLVDDLIVAMPDEVGDDEHMQNVAKAEFTGVELEGEWRLAPEWTAYGCMAFVEGRDKTGDEYLRFTPPLNGLVGLRYEQESGLWGELELDWAAHQGHTPKGTPDGESWASLNARIGYRFVVGATRQEVVLSGENLANADYTNYLSTSRGVELREPGINATASWRMEF
jgi:hemoglobin/transferrin/lactoferrin receptor protein